MDETLVHRIVAAVARNPAAPAFVYRGEVLQHRHLLALICVAAATLRDKGVRGGEYIGVSMAASPLHCAAVLALARLGAVIVPVMNTWEPAVKSALAAKYGIRFLLTDIPDEAIAGVPTLWMDTVNIGRESDLESLGPWPGPEAPLRLALTSGTTGAPKGVLHSHRDFLHRMDLTATDCDARARLLPPDLRVTVALMFALGALAGGGCVVFPRSIAPQDLVTAVNLHGVTHWLLAPNAVAQVEAAMRFEGCHFPSLRHLRIVGATPTPRMLETLRTRFSPNVYVPYGLTEIGPVSMATPEVLAQAPQSAGHVLPGVEVQIVDEQGRAVPQGSGGELRVRTPHMPAGYHREPPGAHAQFRDGWFYPGDLARLSPEGLLFIEGRLDDVINLGGLKVSPGYVEEVLARHPRVREAAVFAWQPAGGELRLAAAIVADGKPSGREILAASRETLMQFTPERVVFVDALPRHPSGKLDRTRVPGLAAPQLAAAPAA